MYTIDRDLDHPLYIQVRDNIIKALEEGRLKPGDRLPSVSTLAREIGVTQATIRRALQDLVDAGQAECHVGRGTFICQPGAVEGQEASVAQADAAELAEEEARDGGAMYSRSREHAVKRLRTGVSKALYDIIPLAHRPGIIALTRGTPDEKMIPEGFLEQMCEHTLKAGAARYIQATDPAGMYELRAEIARLASRDGSFVTPEMVLITNGVMQAISLTAQYAIERQPEIVCETPCFQGVPNAFTAMGHWVETVQRDEDGPIIQQLQRFVGMGPRLLYICPYAHNPMGTDLSAGRREELVAWARRTGCVIIADEIFRELRFSDVEQPSLLKDLGDEQTIVVSSMSKSIMPGLRIGWIITSPQRIQDLIPLKRLMDQASPTFMQGMALAIFQSGKFEDHTQQMRQVYRRRMDTLIQSLEKMMPKEVRWSRPDGGFSILLELPRGYSSIALLLSAIEMGVSFLPGPLFDLDQRYVHALRLSTACSDEHQIKEGVELLASAIETFLKTPLYDTGLSGLGGCCQ